jgi:hypothetical protein
MQNTFYIMPKKKMKKEEMKMDKCCTKCKSGGMNCGGGCAYFLGFIGAAVYYIQTAAGFWSGVLGVLKALVWPAFLIYELLVSMGA